jgi:hypothetical protein
MTTTTTIPERTEFDDAKAETRADAARLKITRPGCYVCNQTGRLIRVCADDITSRTGGPGANEPALVTKLSDNPYLPVSQARLKAANLDVEISF